MYSVCLCVVCGCLYRLPGAPAGPLARVDSLRDPEQLVATRRMPQQMARSPRVAPGDSLTSIMWDAYQYGVSLAAPTRTGSLSPSCLVLLSRVPVWCVPRK